MASATEPRNGRAGSPRPISGKWLIPALFVGFVLFTVGMSFATIILGKAMRPALERRQIESQKAEMRREAAEGKAPSGSR